MTEAEEEIKIEGSQPVACATTYPEGGARAWLVVLGCFCVMFFTFGYLNAFGVYETYYQKELLHEYTPSAISWIGSLQVFLQFAAGIIAGPITDLWGPRVIIWPFSIIYVAAVMLTSVCTKYWHFILAQGLLGGLANGLAYAPAIAVIGQYFHKRRALAMGIASSGSSLGGIIFPVMLNRLIYHTSLGFGWTVRIVGFLVLGLCLTACATVVPRMPPRKGKYFLLHAFKHPVYSTQVAGMFLVWWGLFTPFFFLPAYSEAKGLDMDLSIYTLAVLNSGSLIGRILSGIAAPRFGRFNLLVMGNCVCGILVFCWLRVVSTAAIYVFAVLYGMFSGFVVALFPTTIAEVCTHPTEIGSYVGMALGLYGIAGLTGTPITGAMIAQYGGYDEAIIFSGSVLMAGTALTFCARSLIAKSHGWRV
ncbi:Aspyridones efflux protein apdF [Exophiala dermatitidis]